MDFSAGAAIGNSINHIENELRIDQAADLYVQDKEVQTLPFISMLTNIDEATSMKRNISVDDSSPVKSIIDTPHIRSITPFTEKEEVKVAPAKIIEETKEYPKEKKIINNPPAVIQNAKTSPKVQKPKIDLQKLNNDRAELKSVAKPSDNSNEQITSLLNERNKVTDQLRELDYFTNRGCQEEPMKVFKKSPRLANTVATQFPEGDDIFNQIIGDLDPFTVAQTQLTLLEHALEKIRLEGSLSHLNLTPEDIAVIKREMINLLKSRIMGIPVKDFIDAHHKGYSGGISFKSTAMLNFGMKDPSLQYSTAESTLNTGKRNHPKISTVVNFWRKAKKKN